LSIRRILIANRGEIAARIARTCRELGIETVLAASEADRESLPARLVTRVVCIGPAHPSASYLQPGTLVQAALGTGCDALHPGYGFLSERADFARLCEQHGLIFIGPTSGQLAAAGEGHHLIAAGSGFVVESTEVTVASCRRSVAFRALTGGCRLALGIAGEAAVGASFVI